MSTRITIVSLVAAFALLVVVIELVRRRRLGERYALMWLLTCGVVVFFAAWPSALEEASSWVGIAYPPTALFLVAAAFILLVLLHYATVISSLVDRNVTLAQQIGLLEERIRRLEGATAGSAGPTADAEPPADRHPATR